MKGHPEKAWVHESIEPSELLHRRLAHVHYRALPLARKFVEGLQEIQTKHDGVCKGCAKGKNTKNTFPSSEIVEKGILEIMHSDVCSPMPSNSLSGYVYYVFFIDDFSRKTWIYLLKNKDEVFSKFKELKALIENHIEIRSRLLDQIMVKNSHQMNSDSYAKIQGLRGS